MKEVLSVNIIMQSGASFKIWKEIFLMQDLRIFKNEQFGNIRVMEQNGEPWFVGKDVADILGYQNGSRDINRHVDEEDRHKVKIFDGNQDKETIIINESGLYSLILSSKLPAAKKFKRWVTSEVLPSIRKHGGYIAGQETMSGDELIARALLVAQSKIEEKDRQIEEMTPKAIFADAVSASHTSILVGELAKMLKQNGIDIGQNRLFQWMRDKGYLISRKGTDYNMPTQRSMEMGLFEIKETAITHSDGHTSISKTTKVTGKGQQYFINKFMEVA